MLFSTQNTEEEKQLFRACRYGDLDTVKASKVALQDVRHHVWSNCSPLHHAARLYSITSEC